MKKVIAIIGCFLFLICSVLAQQIDDKQDNKNFKIGIPATFASMLNSASVSIELPKDGIYEVYQEEQLLFNAVVKKNKLHGEWQSLFTNGRLIDSGYLVAGRPDGVWKVWDSAGKLVALRTYNAHKLELVKQEMKLNHPRNHFYGLTAIYKIDPQQAISYLHPQFPLTSLRNNKEVYSLEKLVLENQSGNSYQTVFNECLHDGLFMNFFSNGNSKDSGSYKDGLQEAVWLHRNYPDGHYWIGAYRKGKRVHEWKEYTAGGKLAMIIFYNREGEEKGRKKIGH